MLTNNSPIDISYLERQFTRFPVDIEDTVILRGIHLANPVGTGLIVLIGKGQV